MPSLSFFFQAEDGIRDFHVTGVQTCALPILTEGIQGAAPGDANRRLALARGPHRAGRRCGTKDRLRSLLTAYNSGNVCLRSPDSPTVASSRSRRGTESSLEEERVSYRERRRIQRPRRRASSRGRDG